MHLAEGPDHTWDEWVEGGRAGKTHHDAALFASRRAAGSGKGTIHLIEDRAGALKKGGTSVRKLYAPGFTPKKLHIQLAFKGADLLAERRLLHAQALGGPGDVAFFGHGNEVAEVA
ncbi:MAG TPA: hypothetical protein VIZ63_03545 [Povalibacter sp.]